MTDWRKDIFLDIEKKARKKVARRNFINNELFGMIVGAIASSIVVIPLFFLSKAPIWFCAFWVLVISLFSYFIFTVGKSCNSSQEIEREVGKQAKEVFPAIAEKTDMYALSSVYIYKDLKDTYCEKRAYKGHIDLQTLHETIQNRNRDILTEVRQSIIKGDSKMITCPICYGMVLVKNDVIIESCSCKGVQMYQKENKKELF